MDAGVTFEAIVAEWSSALDSSSGVPVGTSPGHDISLTRNPCGYMAGQLK